MSATPVVAIFDIGKTNKKVFLFTEDYKIVYEESVFFPEVVDEEGDPCESLSGLQAFIHSSLQKVFGLEAFEIRAVNFSAYGASFVHLDEKGLPVTPLYNYLKEYPKDLLRQFYDTYGGEQNFSVAMSSPVLGHLNSGMQLYWLKYAKPQLFNKIAHSLHLPQYLCFLLTGNYFSELTSIGCHTNMWDFSRGAYHEWMTEEYVLPKLAPIVSSTHVIYPTSSNGSYCVGVGLHDSSAALIPYFTSFQEPFILLSTGTWCITLNPFNHTPVNHLELEQDCLCYLTYQGTPVKASRLFAGNEHEHQVRRLSEHFGKSADYYKSVKPDTNLLHAPPQQQLRQQQKAVTLRDLQPSPFSLQDLSSFASYEEAYHHLMQGIIMQQIASTELVMTGTSVKQIFVDGGFSKNHLYMYLLAAAFPGIKVYAASMAQASAMGAALAIHSSWNSRQLPGDIIELEYFGVAQKG